MQYRKLIAIGCWLLSWLLFFGCTRPTRPKRIPNSYKTASFASGPTAIQYSEYSICGLTLGSSLLEVKKGLLLEGGTLEYDDGIYFCSDVKTKSAVAFKVSGDKLAQIRTSSRCSLERGKIPIVRQGDPLTVLSAIPGKFQDFQTGVRVYDFNGFSIRIDLDTSGPSIWSVYLATSSYLAEHPDWQ